MPRPLIEPMHYHLVASLFLFSVLCPSAKAQLDGQALDAEWRYPDLNTTLESHAVTVDNQVELPADMILFASNFDIDIGEDWVEFRFISSASWSDATFNGWWFHDRNDALGPIVSFEYDSSSPGIGGLSGMVTDFSEDSFWADLSRMTVEGSGDWIRFKVIVHSAPTLAVTDIIPGEFMTFHVSNLTSESNVVFVISSLGPGPTTTPFGILEVTSPWRTTPRFPANVNREYEFTSTLPAGASGSTINMQCVEFRPDSTTELSNALAVEIP